MNKVNVMKIVKISSLGCPSCIIMNKVFNKIKENYSFDYEEFDYDFDETDSFNAGNVMPVYIFYKNILKIFGVRIQRADPDTIYGIKCKTSNYTLYEHCKELLLAH